MRVLTLLLLVLIVWCVAVPARADTHVEDDLGLWAPVWLQKEVPGTKDKVYLTLMAQPRMENNIRQMDQLLVFPGAGYRVNKILTLEAGYGWVGLFGDEAARNFKAEHRLWQGFWLRKDIGKLKAYHRTRLEERFMPTADDAALRLRTMTGGRYFLGDSKWYLVASDEFFWNATEHDGGPQAGFDQNRLFTGVGKDIHENLRVEGGYQMQYVNRPSPAVDRMNHLILVQMFYTLR